VLLYIFARNVVELDSKINAKLDPMTNALSSNLIEFCCFAKKGNRN